MYPEIKLENVKYSQAVQPSFQLHFIFLTTLGVSAMPIHTLSSALVRGKYALHSSEVSFNPMGCLFTRRGYHDKSFGFRQRREYVFPDCELISSGTTRC